MPSSVCSSAPSSTTIVGAAEAGSCHEGSLGSESGSTTGPAPSGSRGSGEGREQATRRATGETSASVRTALIMAPIPAARRNIGSRRRPRGPSPRGEGRLPADSLTPRGALPAAATSVRPVGSRSLQARRGRGDRLRDRWRRRLHRASARSLNASLGGRSGRKSGGPLRLIATTRFLDHPSPARNDDGCVGRRSWRSDPTPSSRLALAAPASAILRSENTVGAISRSGWGPCRGAGRGARRRRRERPPLRRRGRRSRCA